MFWPPLKCHILSLKTVIVSQHQGWTVGHYHFTDPAYADDAIIIMSDQLQADRVLQSIPLLPYAYWALSYRGQR